MCDFLSDLLQAYSLKSEVYFERTFHTPWGMDMAASPFSQFHMITRGRAALRSVHLSEDVTLESGDIVLCIRGASHQLADVEAIRCISGLDVVEAVKRGEDPFPGLSPGATLICGHFQLSPPMDHPIFNELPEILILQGHQYLQYGDIRNWLDQLFKEQKQQLPGYNLNSQLLAQMILISVLRYYYVHVYQGSNFISDRAVYQALNLIHQSPENEITVADMAREAGVSRTLFMNRFRKVVGETPKKYLTRWRLTLAGKMLRERNLRLDQVASAVGYKSEAAFNRAFKRHYAQTPGQFRSNH